MSKSYREHTDKLKAINSPNGLRYKLLEEYYGLSRSHGLTNSLKRQPDFSTETYDEYLKRCAAYRELMQIVNEIEKLKA